MLSFLLNVAFPPWSHTHPHLTSDCDPYGFPTGITPPVDYEEEVAHDPNGEALTLEAKMQPLQLDSMTKSKDGFLGVRKETELLLIVTAEELV